MSLDPYASPNFAQSPVASSGPAVDSEAIRMLQLTRPWVRFCSVIGFIGTGFLILGGLAMLVGGAIAGASTRTSAVPFPGFNIVFGLVYLVMAALYVFPSIKLWSYGSAITRLMMSGSSMDLVQALNLQRSFWKFVGIMVCVIMVIYALAIVVAIFGVMATRTSHL
ncbi:hypothetical protein KBB96_03155 [Luteolibacter ambystomatis]|uniref:Uncharacterized protein n=1 Tax=Luteolibacter ambystomatis TaxID=2824561 RepID=A0A975PF95_9BACT|nr:DUF5362 family protein [Luteolibacter ambystomatis]QUE51893.1 hypothetical protein KBB96_03155 [Luteolibacter ambystomatis]